ncbi:hypothetical protein [Hymenobacter sp. GOD-10R]|uniref:hypothetical protein n=1 Tax=Hymenobacter sp. GOD-10R TaxID=3093922 RepID=UPI002D79A5A0|nr:hypothetical protein [Hymenobacter sp. GOD-10R]WRQ31822.1 hypothetical protein SD425_29195 [Hymenobacter sp. GOD-10R]
MAITVYPKAGVSNSELLDTIYSRVEAGGIPEWSFDDSEVPVLIVADKEELAGGAVQCVEEKLENEDALTFLCTPKPDSPNGSYSKLNGLFVTTLLLYFRDKVDYTVVKHWLDYSVVASPDFKIYRHK